MANVSTRDHHHFEVEARDMKIYEEKSSSSFLKLWMLKECKVRKNEKKKSFTENKYEPQSLGVQMEKKSPRHALERGH
jgi:hypothetical protein